MSLITEQVVINEAQNWVWSTIVMTNESGVKVARVVYNKKNADGKIVDSKAIEYTGEDYNTWYNAWDDGELIAQELIDELELNIAVPENVDDEFINNI